MDKQLHCYSITRKRSVQRKDVTLTDEYTMTYCTYDCNNKIFKKQFQQQNSSQNYQQQIEQGPQQNFKLQKNYTKTQPRFIQLDIKKQKKNISLFKIILFSIMMLFLYFLIKDLFNKVEYLQKELELEKEICLKEFEINQCESPVPQTEIYCAEKEKCLNSDLHNKFYLKALILVISDIFETLCQVFSLKTFFVLIIVAFLLSKL